MWYTNSTDEFRTYRRILYASICIWWCMQLIIMPLIHTHTQFNALSASRLLLRTHKYSEILNTHSHTHTPIDHTKKAMPSFSLYRSVYAIHKAAHNVHNQHHCNANTLTNVCCGILYIYTYIRIVYTRVYATVHMAYNTHEIHPKPNPTFGYTEPKSPLLYCSSKCFQSRYVA